MKPDPTKKAAQDAEDIRRGAVFAIDVQTQGGQKLMLLMEAKLAERLLELANHDPYCQGIVAILSDIGYNVQLAADKSAQLMARQASNG